MPPDPTEPSESTGIKEPPKKLGGMLRYWGPGLIMTAGVVGSGELIATTGLGARAGFVALWLILLSCVIKVAVQLMLGRFAIYSGKRLSRRSMIFRDRDTAPLGLSGGGCWSSA